MKKLHVVLTIDVEIPTSESHDSSSGPPDHESGGKWSRAYADIATRFGLPVTFFVHPEVMLKQSALYQQLESEGHCLGLHIHAWRFDRRYQCEFGGLTENQARQMLSEATGMWQSVCGNRPEYFRPGTMSSNDSIFRVLNDLGFRGGSMSLPGRVFPDKHAVWAGAPLDPHRAHSHFRLLEGEMEFANMPVSVDTSQVHEKDGRTFYMDLRPDFVDVDQTATVNKVLDQLIARDPEVPCINLVTHNDYDFSDPDCLVTRNFVEILTSIQEGCQSRGIEWQGSTLADICDQVLALPAKPTVFDPSGGRVMFDEDTRQSST